MSSYFTSTHMNFCSTWKVSMLKYEWKKWQGYFWHCISGDLKLFWHVQYHCYPFLPTGDSFKANLFLVWHHLPRTRTKPRRVTGSYSGMSIPGFSSDNFTMFLLGTELPHACLWRACAVRRFSELSIRATSSQKNFTLSYIGKCCFIRQFQ